MKFSFVLFSSWLFFCILSPLSLFALDGESYETYKSQATETCESNKPWVNPDERIPDFYSELTKVAIEKKMQDMLAGKNTPEELEKLKTELDASRIANLETFKVLEVARLEYRQRMNGVFGCAIIQSRENLVKNLLEKIKTTYPSPPSDIEQKIRRESERLKISKEGLGCTTEGADITAPGSIRLINSATRQYCHYDTYLAYLRDNLEKNNTYMLELESRIAQIGNTVDTSVTPKERQAWAQEISQRTSYLRDEAEKAKMLLPQAVRAFREMEKTYNLHLMLVVIYDDYSRLRDNLGLYFNALTQLMEKMNNAQIPNTSK